MFTRRSSIPPLGLEVMPTIEEIPLGELPERVIESAARNLAEYSIGFVRVEESRSGHDAVLLGSGTLVSIGAIHAVLTAHHVVSILPRTGRLGLILSQGALRSGRSALWGRTEIIC